MAEPLLLEVKDLNIEFHDHLIPETVVYDFDLELKAGEIVGLVGESGSGKSMSALAIAGLLSRRDMHKRGQILFDGLELLTCERSKLRKIQGNEISMIFQEPMTSLNPVLTVGFQIQENIIEHLHLSKEDAKKRALEMLKLVGIPSPEKRFHSYPHEFSGGMRQRAMIAMALSCEPELLIADEPTTALDVTIQAQVLSLMKELNERLGTATILITHNLGCASSICDRIIVMYGGKIMEEKKNLLTYAGLKKLEDELHDLKVVKR